MARPAAQRREMVMIRPGDCKRAAKGAKYRRDRSV